MLYYEHEQDRIERIVNYKLHGKMIFDYSHKHYYLTTGCGFDIETSKIQVDDGYTGYCYHWAFSMDDVVIAGRTLDSMESFFRFLSEVLHGIDKRPKLMVLDANLGYEWQYCKKYWNAIGLTGLFTKEKRNPLKIEIANQIEMREVIGLFGTSLNDIAKNYCTTKKMVGDLDYSLVRLSRTKLKPKDLVYIENDVKILSELGNHIFANFFGRNKSLPMTSTGMIRAKIKAKIKNIKDVKYQVRENLPCEQDYNDFRRFLFKGGICGTNSLYMNVVLEDVVCADYTSDYPAVMFHFDYPMGKCEVCNTREFLSEKRVPYIGLFEFVNIRSTTTHSLMSSHKCMNNAELNASNSTIDNGRIYSADRIILFLNDVEYKAFVKAYTWDRKESSIIKCWKFERYGKLPNYVLDVLEEQYRIKEELSASGKKGTIEYVESKKCVNGIFGMMCTSIFTDDFVFNDEGEIDENKDENGMPIKKPFDEAIKSMFLSPFWGFWITSYARYLLMDIIIRFPECIVQYDTDSIYYVKSHPKARELEEFIVDYNNRIYAFNDKIFGNDKHMRTLGAWEVEKPFKRFKGLGSKRYMYEKQNGELKFVVSGCRKVLVDNNNNKTYDESKGRYISTIEWQYIHDKPNCDIFDYFTDGMYIDKEHCNKLSSKYVDEEFIVNYTDCDGNSETIRCPSAVVLEDTDFTMGVSSLRTDFINTVQAIYNNSGNDFLEELWKRLGI